MKEILCPLKQETPCRPLQTSIKINSVDLRLTVSRRFVGWCVSCRGGCCLLIDRVFSLIKIFKLSYMFTYKLIDGYKYPTKKFTSSLYYLLLTFLRVVYSTVWLGQVNSQKGWWCIRNFGPWYNKERFGFRIVTGLVSSENPDNLFVCLYVCM